MFKFAGEAAPLVNLIFLVVTGFIAVHGVQFRDKEGNSDFVHLLFGCIAGMFFLMVLFQDVLGVVKF